jgi:hypothetical protein
MEKMHKLFLNGLLVLALVTLTSCGPAYQAKAYASAEIEIEMMRKQSNWKGVRKKTAVCMPVVKQVDARHGTDYSTQIPEALIKCEQGERSHVNQQMIGKGLQHVTVMAIYDELEQISNSGDDAALRVAAYFEGIRLTFIRRDQDFFSEERTLENRADKALGKLTSPDAGPDGVTEGRQELTDAINHTYALSVLFEFSDVATHRAADLRTSEKKMEEARLFYRIISDTVRSRSSKADQAIAQMLTDMEQVQPDVAEVLLTEAFHQDFKLR